MEKRSNYKKCKILMKLCTQVYFCNEFVKQQICKNGFKIAAIWGKFSGMIL